MSSVDTVPGVAAGEFDATNWDWADRGTPHVSFSKDEPLPFQEGDILGHGVNGPVIQTVVKGVRVAVKRIYCRRGIGQKELKEIEIVRKLKHPHIIQLAGSYSRGPYLGILLHPVATCDLATFLEDVDFFQWLPRHSPAEFMERRSRCAAVSRTRIIKQDIIAVSSDLAKAAQARIWECYGCIASAMLYLHGSSIRHRDPRPLNILLSPDDLWITDFGHSLDFSEFSDSATTGGERGTIKYCAPEVAAWQRSGRSADVFSLGCIFFEMATLRCFTLKEMKDLRPSMDQSFHNNLENISPVFDTFGSTHLDHLPMSLVKRMLSRDPAERPDWATISDTLNLFQSFSTIDPNTFPIIMCPFRRSRRIQPPPVSNVELLITIGNTYHDNTENFVIVEREWRMEYPIVVFVDLSAPEYIEKVIFFQTVRVPTSELPLMSFGIDFGLPADFPIT